MPHHLTLTRVRIIDAGAFGMLDWFGIPFCVTLERTYSDGPRGTLRVKIPPGEYKCVRRMYHKPKVPYPTWHIIGGEVTAERLILFHKANLEGDLDGCVGVGESLSPFRDSYGILQSGEAHKELMTLSEGYEELDLLVRNA